VPIDAAVARAVVDQVPFAIAAPRSRATQQLERLADRLLGRAPVPAPKAFWERVVGWHRRSA
jgi:MinD-like ATPase involved in chromosome partitioning or flagellar assembly